MNLEAAGVEASDWRLRHEQAYHEARFAQLATELAVDLFDNWFDPIEAEVRARSRQFIEELIRGELDAALARPRYERSQRAGNETGACVTGHRHGSRTRSLTGTFGPIEIAVPRARLTTPEGKTTEWKSQALRAYQRRTLAADALIASSYLAGTNTRRVRRALAALFGGTVGKDTVSRTWRKVKGDWDAWNSPGRGADRAPDPRRHRRSGAPRPQGDLDLVACCAWRASGRPEGSARDQEHGRRKRRGMAHGAGRSHQARAQPPAEADIQRHFRVSPPTVHQMIVTLERNGFIRRQPGIPRSIEIPLPPENLPILEWLGIKTSKSL